MKEDVPQGRVQNQSSHRPIVLLESGIFFLDYRYLCHQVPDRLTAFLIFWFQIVIMVELLVQKNQQVEILIFTKVMAKKVKNFRSFFEKVAVVWNFCIESSK
jgi:uncharacterized membrane protein